MELVVTKYMRCGLERGPFTAAGHVEEKGKVEYSIVEAVRLLPTFELSIDDVFNKASLWCGADILQRTPGDMYYDYLRVASPVAWAGVVAYLVQDGFGGLFM